MDAAAGDESGGHGGAGDENTGFELIIPPNVGQNEPPTDEELRILREEVDPEQFYI